MCSFKIRDRLLNSISFIIILSFLSGCYSGAKYYHPNNVNEEKITIPELGIISQVSLGEPIITSGYGHYSKGIEIKNSISIKMNLGGIITISKGFYELVYSIESECYYTPIDDKQINFGDPDVNCQIRISDLNKIDIIAEGADAIYSALAIPITQPLDYEKIDSIFISKKDSFQQTMIYSGKLNNIIKFSYREFTDDYIRNSFTTDVSYDLSESNIIGYKNFKAEIIEATNIKLKYKIISSF